MVASILVVGVAACAQGLGPAATPGRDFAQYRTLPHYRAFVLTGGKLETSKYVSGWSSGATSIEDVIDTALSECRSRAGPTLPECRLYAIGDLVVVDASPTRLNQAKCIYALSSAATSMEDVNATRCATTQDTGPTTASVAQAKVRHDDAVESASRAIPAGDLDRAIQEFSQALVLTPDDKTAIDDLYIAYVRRAGAAELHDDKLALADYTRAIELKPTVAFAYKRRGQLQLERGAAAAVADLTRALQLEPGNAAIANLLTGALQAVAVAEAAVAPASPPAGSVLEGSKSTASVPQRPAAAPIPQSEPSVSVGPDIPCPGRRYGAPGAWERLPEHRSPRSQQNRKRGWRTVGLATDPPRQWWKRLCLQKMARGIELIPTC